ncbi:MAG TPA: sialate O-acetylesterase [Trueperaceae bacterium]|nr:sialate O-acetylesterase [Trueperaceae bacterium]
MRHTDVTRPRHDRLAARKRLGLWLLPLLLLVACSDPFAMPVIEEFSASPTILAEDETTAVTLSWTVANEASVHLTSDKGLNIEVTGLDSYELDATGPTLFTLSARNLFGGVTRELRLDSTPPSEEPPGEEPPGEEPPGEEPPGEEPPGEEPGTGPEKILILVAGQSNAAGRGLPFPEGKEVAIDGVFMLTEGASSSDWHWVTAAEPTDTYPEAKQHSFLVRLGNDLKQATGRDVYLVQAAVGGKAMRYWLPGGSSGLFDNAFERAMFAADDLEMPVSAVAWYQGESDSQYAAERDLYTSRTRQVFEAFHDGLPGSPPILFVQLANRLFNSTEPDRNLAYQAIREMQRALDPRAVNTNVVQPGADPGSAGNAPSYYRLVVAHDLPMSDEIHLGSAGQKYLGSRLAHAFLTEVWEAEGSRSVDRRGPRLVRIERSGVDTLRLVLDRAINASSSYGGYFTVLVNGTPVGLSSVGRDPGNASAIVLVTSGPLPSDLGSIDVRYMPPDDVGLYATSEQAVHAFDAATELRLPLPAFGKPSESVPSSFQQLY